MYKVAVIGCGWIGLAHAQGYQAIKECSLEGAVDPAMELAKKMTESYGGKAYASFEDMAKEFNPDIVSICTPPSLHETMVQKALKAGVRWIVCEKPLAHSYESASRIGDLVKSHGAVLMTAFCHRFAEPIIRIREMIRSGELGDIVIFRNEFASIFTGVQDRWFSKKDVSGGGTTIDTSVHSIDLFRFLCGEPKNVSARMAARMPGLEVEDTACLLLQTEGGTIGIIEASWNLAAGQAFVEVCGTKGRVSYQYWGPFRVIKNGDADWTSLTVERDINLRFEDELRNFVRVIEGKTSEYPCYDDGIQANRIIQAAYQSIEKKTWIEL